MIKQPSLTRRHYLAATGAGVLALGLGATRGVAAPETIKQGYQTNIWGMPTYYLMKSGYLEKHNLAAEEFAVPSETSPCSRWWRARSISAPMRANPSSSAAPRAGSSPLR